MRKVFLCVFFLVAISFVPCEEVLFRVTKDTPAWNGDIFKKDNIVRTIKKDEIVKGRNFFIDEIDKQWLVLQRVEYNDREYVVQADMLVPANTVDLFDDSWITKPSNNPDSLWLIDYYLSVLLSENRNTFYEYEYKIMDYWDETKTFGIAEWYESVYIYSRLDIYQIGIYAGGFQKKKFFITNIVKINNGYKITVIDRKYVKNDKELDYENTIAFPTDRIFFDLLLIKDNDFIDMYLDTTKNHLATFVRVNKDIADELTSLLENNTCDLSKIKSWPKRADGSTIKYSPPAKNADISQTEDKISEAAIEKKAITQNNGEASTLPLWAWFAIIGIAVAVTGGVAVFVIKRKK